MRRSVTAALFAALVVGCGCEPPPGSEARDGSATVEVVMRPPALEPLAFFDPPVPRPEAISSTFGPRWKISAARDDFHLGIDWFDAEGTPLTAIGDGGPLASTPWFTQCRFAYRWPQANQHEGWESHVWADADCSHGKPLSKWLGVGQGENDNGTPAQVRCAVDAANVL